MTPFSFRIVTFGCKVSQYESQAVREYWTDLGGQETEDSSLADVILIATCAVTAEAVGEARRMVRRLGREAPRARMLVTGCAATAEPADFALPGVAAVIPQRGRACLLRGHPLEEDFCQPEQGSHSYPPFQIRAFRRARPVLKVQDGCSHRCAYCIVPLTRGPARGRDPEECLTEAQRLLEAGYREIMISGINLRQYRHSGLDFWGLLRKLDQALAPEWEGRARFRLSSLEPAQLDQEGLESLESCRLLCPHLHLSLQSGSPEVLRRMGREHYRPEAVLDAVDRLRRFWPVLGLGADILMGFPGEGEIEVTETLDMIRLLPLTYAHVFPWSSRPGTRAATMPDAAPKAVRQERAARVRALVAQKTEAFLQAQARQKVFRLALDGDGSRIGHNEYYVSCRLEGEGQGLELVACRPVRVEEGKLVCTLS